MNQWQFTQVGVTEVPATSLESNSFDWGWQSQQTQILANETNVKRLAGFVSIGFGMLGLFTLAFAFKAARR